MTLPILAILAGALLAACGSSGSGGAEQFRLGTDQAVETLNPLEATTAAAEGIVNLIYPRLVQWNEDQTELVADFAESWEISDGGRTVTFDTQTGQWSDGEPLTADDAAWSINTFLRFQDGTTGSYSDYVAGVSEAEAIDDETLVVTYDEPQASPLSQLQRATILPRHVWEEHATGNDGGGLLEFSPPPEEAVTGGPFTVQRFDPDGGIVLLERDPNFYGDEATVEVLGFQAFTSPDALIAALRNDEIDGIELLPPNTPLAELEDGDAQIGEAPGGAMDWIILNSNPKKPEHRELLEDEVRLALNHAIDRDAIVETALRGNGEPGTSFLPVGSEFHDDSIEAPEFDLDRANELLDDAGLERGDDGARVNEDGEKMEYTVFSAPSTNARAFQIVQDAWREIGVNVSRRVLDVPALIEAIAAPDGEALEYDIAVWGFNAGPDPTTILSLPTCAQRGIFNEPYFCDREYDRLFTAQGVEQDVDERKRTIDQMQQILAEKLPYLVMDSQTAISALAEGWKPPEMSLAGYFQIRFSKLPLTYMETD